MPMICSRHAVQLSHRRRRCSSFPVDIPSAELRRRRQQIGLAPATKLDHGRPSSWRVGNPALHDPTFRAVLMIRENDAFPLPVK